MQGLVHFFQCFDRSEKETLPAAKISLANHHVQPPSKSYFDP